MKTYCVYEHVFPNGKKYIGVSSDPEKRWRNGKGYETQGKIANAIKHYGWENVRHNIICEGLTKAQAEALEKYLVGSLDTIDNGYNTVIGGENINTTFLNGHILYMIRESKALDAIYEETQSPDGIVSLFESGKHNAELATYLNRIDDLIEDQFSDYKKLDSNRLFDGRYERCEAYWYYARELWERTVAGEAFDKSDVEDYLTARWRRIWRK